MKSKTSYSAIPGDDYTREGYTYKGVTYSPWKDYEDDNIKIFHDVEFDGSNANHGISELGGSMDWSPYSTPSVAMFQLWVDLGFPKRVGTGPLNEDDLLKLKKERENV